MTHVVLREMTYITSNQLQDTASRNKTIRKFSSIECYKYCTFEKWDAGGSGKKEMKEIRHIYINMVTQNLNKCDASV